MLVGRRLAVNALRSAVDAALRGAGGVVLLAGEAGMGKTALASEAAAYAKTQGRQPCGGPAGKAMARLVSGHGSRLYGRWYREAAIGRGRACRLTGVTGARRRPWAMSPRSASVPMTLAATYLRGRAAQRPLVVVLDDLHWADARRRCGCSCSSPASCMTPPRSVIGTYRDVEVTAGDHPARPLLAELAGQAEPTTAHRPDGRRGWPAVREGMRSAPPAPLVRAVYDRTAGNPFFAQQIARLLAAQGVPLDRPR